MVASVYPVGRRIPLSLPKAQRRLGFIGAGAMAEAILQGVLTADLLPAESIVAYDIRQEHVQQLAERWGIVAAETIEEAARAEIVLFAVKPQHLHDVLADIAPAIGEGQCIVSIAAGISIAAIEQRVGTAVPVVRVMPNTPCLVGEGAIAVARGSAATDEHEAAVVRLFGAVGEVVVVPEEQIDIVTGLSGSGPAYVCMVIEAMADGAVAAGMARDLALRLATQTVLGTGRLVREGLQMGEHPAVLRERVTSPAGTTARGLGVLEEKSVRAAFSQAVQAAVQRAKELGEES